LRFEVRGRQVHRAWQRLQQYRTHIITRLITIVQKINAHYTVVLKHFACDSLPQQPFGNMFFFLTAQQPS
jgi:hypothetical protein